MLLKACNNNTNSSEHLKIKSKRSENIRGEKTSNKQRHEALVINIFIAVTNLRKKSKYHILFSVSPLFAAAVAPRSSSLLLLFLLSKF